MFLYNKIPNSEQADLATIENRCYEITNLKFAPNSIGHVTPLPGCGHLVSFHLCCLTYIYSIANFWAKCNQNLYRPVCFRAGRAAIWSVRRFHVLLAGQDVRALHHLNHVLLVILNCSPGVLNALTLADALAVHAGRATLGSGRSLKSLFVLRGCNVINNIVHLCISFI